MWSILALGAVERIIHHVIDLDAITRIQLNQLQGQLLRVVIDSPQLSVDVFFDENKLEYWEAHLSDASRQYQHLTWWEAEQIQKAIKTVEKQHLQLSL